MTVTPNPAGITIDDREPHEIHHGQVKFAYRLAKKHTGELLHVHGIGWHRWDGSRYALDQRGHAQRAVYADLEHLWRTALFDKELIAEIRKCSSANAVDGVLRIAATLEPFAATVDDIDADPYLLNVANGTLDLHTLQLRPHSPADRITKVSRGAYTADAQAPIWTAFLARVLPDADVRAFMQRLAGLSLIGDVREHILPILTGTGANGKSTFINALLHTLGDYAATAEPELFMHREGAHPTGEMDLLGKRLVVVSESDKDRRLAEATMKRLTGGDPIKARRMRQDFVQFTPSHLAMLVTNHLPRVSGDDLATWRRLRVVPFDVVIPEHEQDSTLDGRLELEADGILAWAAEGLRDYLERRGLDAPAVVRGATDDYQRTSDAVARFIADRCITTPAVKATTQVLYEEWLRWQHDEGCEPLGRRAFGQALDRKGFPTAKGTGGQRFRAGIALRSESGE